MTEVNELFRRIYLTVLRKRKSLQFNVVNEEGISQSNQQVWDLSRFVSVRFFSRSTNFFKNLKNKNYARRFPALGKSPTVR